MVTEALYLFGKPGFGETDLCRGSAFSSKSAE
jgi:hypothetical protein